MFTNVHDEEEKTEENLEEKTVTDNRLLELSLAGAWCLAILWLILLLILIRFVLRESTLQKKNNLRRLRALSMVEEVQGVKRGDGKRRKKRNKNPTSLFKRGSWVSNLNLGFRAGSSSRKTSTTSSLAPLHLLAHDHHEETRPSKDSGESRPPELLLRQSQDQPQTFGAAQHGCENYRRKRMENLGQAKTDQHSSRMEMAENRGGGNRRNGTRGEVKLGIFGGRGEVGLGSRGEAGLGGLGHRGCPAGGETRVTEEL